MIRTGGVHRLETAPGVVGSVYKRNKSVFMTTTAFRFHRLGSFWALRGPDLHRDAFFRPEAVDCLSPALPAPTRC